LVSGLTYLPRVSARNTDLKIFTTNDVKDSGATKIVNYHAEYQGLANSILVDNADAANACTVRINNNFHTITIAPSTFRAFNDAWIEQIEISGASTDCQITSQVSLLSGLK